MNPFQKQLKIELQFMADLHNSSADGFFHLDDPLHPIHPVPNQIRFRSVSFEEFLEDMKRKDE